MQAPPPLCYADSPWTQSQPPQPAANWPPTDPNGRPTDSVLRVPPFWPWLPQFLGFGPNVGGETGGSDQSLGQTSGSQVTLNRTLIPYLSTLAAEYLFLAYLETPFEGLLHGGGLRPAASKVYKFWPVDGKRSGISGPAGPLPGWTLTQTRVKFQRLRPRTRLKTLELGQSKAGNEFNTLEIGGTPCGHCRSAVRWVGWP